MWIPHTPQCIRIHFHRRSCPWILSTHRSVPSWMIITLIVHATISVIVVVLMERKESFSALALLSSTHLLLSLTPFTNQKFTAFWTKTKRNATIHVVENHDWNFLWCENDISHKISLVGLVILSITERIMQDDYNLLQSNRNKGHLPAGHHYRRWQCDLMLSSQMVKESSVLFPLFPFMRAEGNSKWPINGYNNYHIPMEWGGGWDVENSDEKLSLSSSIEKLNVIIRMVRRMLVPFNILNRGHDTPLPRRNH